jgi:hypothetical protein
MQGLLVNPGDTVVAIDGFSLTFVNAAGAVLRMVSVTTAPYLVQPGPRAPWLLLVDRDLPAFLQVRLGTATVAARNSDTRLMATAHKP